MRVGLLRQLAAEATAAVGKHQQAKVGASAASSSGKPVLKGWLGAETRQHALYCFALSISAAMAYRYFVGEPRKQKYADFWRSYDEHADFKRMVKAGVYSDIAIEDFEAWEQAELKKLKSGKTY